MSLKRQAMQGGAFLAIRQCVGMVVGFFALLYVTRAIGPGAYGVFAASFAVYQFAFMVCQLGLNVYLIRLEGEPREEHFHQVFWLLCVFGLLGVVMSLATAPLWQVQSTVPGAFTVPILILMVLPIDLLASVPLAKLERELAYKKVALIEFVASLSLQMGSVLAVAYGFGIWSLVMGVWLQVLVRMAGVFGCTCYRPQWYWRWSLVREAMRFGFSFSCSGWIWQLRALVNPLIVGHSLGIEAVGAVALAIRFVETLSFVRTAIWRLSFAALAKVQGERERLLRAISQGMWLQVISVGLPLAAFSLLGPWFIGAILGREWESTMVLFPYIALATLANTAFSLHASALYAIHQNWPVVVCSLVLVGLFTGAAVLLVPIFGLGGYALAELLAMPGYVVLHRYVVKIIGPVNYRPTLWWFLALSLPLFVAELHGGVFVGLIILALRKATHVELRQLVDVIRPSRVVPDAGR